MLFALSDVYGEKINFEDKLNRSTTTKLSKSNSLPPKRDSDLGRGSYIFNIQIGRRINKHSYKSTSSLLGDNIVHGVPSDLTRT